MSERTYLTNNSDAYKNELSGETNIYIYICDVLYIFYLPAVAA
jgi:hypothetical protein